MPEFLRFNYVVDHKKPTDENNRNHVFTFADKSKITLDEKDPFVPILNRLVELQLMAASISNPSITLSW